MSMALKAVFERDLALAYRQRSELMQPMMFFILVISLFPLGIGPNPETLQKVGPGVIWVAAILSSLLGMERLFKDDYNDGSLEQIMLSATPLPLVVLVKVLAHWLTSIVPLLLLSPLLALFLNLTEPMYWALLSTLLLGTPLLSLVGAIAVGLTLGLNRGGVLLALLLLPVFIPLLIFATAAVEAASLQLPYSAQLAIIGAMLLISLALAPFAIAYALRVSQN
ncbi:heme exporter protein CcmB [Paraglaciecola chathamensis]|jgi:heme exporter protein B|uniref:Heme exporter protein B n=3 Tax=Paraglaciecola chathamensis TaxID=368405 RepID=A0A8H9IA46_9ALTE|nr:MULTISPECIES: heme exporter protein CcmB [Paraglaciecola]AEE22062.1 heme exporter protein CcmB [Glaciecola sp. 4H-3-7+YE-5]MBJ2135429.1 heme exporter protein CcmB [Paraglaciecola chathamensis]MBU3016168.1 heme exporter protein CcmB [Paraglaciecola agarilytica]MDO6838003.1 heme exporter protein CcmB [Paraglaciecola chathamensis]GAC06765.1 heme exporter protein B [Paraglaciecola agarilytica NO2]